jgi:hypothetical protein
MAQHDSFQSRWSGVPEKEKPGLKMLGAIVVVVMALATVAAAYLQLS